jgi:hypothetical protein
MNDPDSYALFCSYVVQEADSGSALVDSKMVNECRRFLRQHNAHPSHSSKEEPAYA